MRIPLDAVWLGEVARQALVFALLMNWFTLTDGQETQLLQLVSLVITGIVGAQTVSSRVAHQAGTTIDELKATAGDNTKVMVPTDVADLGKD